jgi:predicted Zn-dependent protease
VASFLPARFFREYHGDGQAKEADAMATSHFELMLKQQERAQAAAARRARARAQAKAVPKPGKTPTLDFLSGVFLIVGVAIAGGGILAALVF